MKVWITRTEPGASETAGRVRRAGFTPVVAPLLVAEPTADVPPLAEGRDVVFTSPNGPRHFRGDTSGTAWCVGARTAEAAREAGFRDVRTGSGDVKGLTELVVREARRPVVHWAGAHVRGRLAESLREAGHEASRTVAYRARAVRRCPLQSPVDAVLLHSPRAAEVYGHLAPTLARTAVSISPATDAVLDTIPALATIPAMVRYVAERPDDSAMVEALRRASRETPP